MGLHPDDGYFRVTETCNCNLQYLSHSYRVPWYYQSCIYSPTDALVSCL